MGSMLAKEQVAQECAAEAKPAQDVKADGASNCSTDENETASLKESDTEKVPDGFATENKFGDGYRNYEDSARQAEVSRTYNTMHSKQTLEFVREQHTKWLKFDKGEFTAMEVIEMLDDLIDDSDPDNDLPNSIHDFQTAERIREQWPGEEYDWFHLVGLLHDLGKAIG